VPGRELRPTASLGPAEQRGSLCANTQGQSPQAENFVSEVDGEIRL